MPIPQFEDGLLPPGLHRATAEEVRAHLVEPFTDSTTRAAIVAFWEDRRAAITELVDVVGEWLDGSFTTDKRDPADIDLMTIIDGAAFDELPRHRRQVVASLVAGTTTEEFWSCDAGVVVHYPADDRSHSRTAVAAGCWAGYFGHTREGTPTGIVELIADDHDPIDVALEDDAAEDAEAQLRAHLDRFDRALQAFDDPEATQRPGLRLMATTLRAKRDELAAKLASKQQVEVQLTPSGDQLAPAPAMADLVSALCAATTAIGTQLVTVTGGDAESLAPTVTAQALQQHLTGGERDGAVILRGADTMTRRSIHPPEGHESVLTGALHALLDALDDDPSVAGSQEVAAASAEAASAAAALRRIIIHHGVAVDIELSWPFGEHRSVQLRP